MFTLGKYNVAMFTDTQSRASKQQTNKHHVWQVQHHIGVFIINHAWKKKNIWPKLYTVFGLEALKPSEFRKGSQ